MDKITWTELKRFIKRNYKKILVFSLIAGLTYTLVSIFVLSNEETENIEETENVTEELANYFTGFQIYIEYDDGKPFTNTTLMEEYVLKYDVVEEAELSTEVSIISKMEELEEAGFEKGGHDRGVLGVIRGNHSNIFTVLVNAGTNSENMKIADYYFDELTSGNVNFLNNKDVHIWSEPQLLLDYETGLNENDPNLNEIESSSWGNYIIDMTIGTVFGLIVSSLLLLLISTFRNNDLYSFSYNRGSDDVFLLYDPALKNADEIAQLIAYPLSYDKLIIHNTGLPENLKIALDLKLRTLNESLEAKYVSKMSDATVMSENTEIIIVLNSSQDSKKWYRAQRKLADIYKFPVKVVQVNS